MKLKVLPLAFNSHKRTQPKKISASEPPSYASLSYEDVLGSANSTLYSLGTFDLGIFTPHPGRNMDYNTKDIYDCTSAYLSCLQKLNAQHFQAPRATFR